jgi:hypothetical protein
VGRRTALATAAIFQILFLASVAFWDAYVRGLRNSMDPREPPLLLSVIFVMTAASVYGLTEGTFFTFIPATLQTYFGKGEFSSCANAAFRLWSALGFALQASLSTALHGRYISEQHAVMLLLCLLSHMCLLWLHLRVCSVDGPCEAVDMPKMSSADMAASCTTELPQCLDLLAPNKSPNTVSEVVSFSSRQLSMNSDVVPFAVKGGLELENGLEMELTPR